MDDQQLTATVTFAYEVGHLSRCARGGWQLAGIAAPESVAEHSHRVGALAAVIATLEGADPHRAATLGVFHDVPETRSTDLHSVAKRHVAAEPPTDTAGAQSSGMPRELGWFYVGLVQEFEQRVTPEARCAKDADKLDCLLRAREYQEQGAQTVQPFVDNMLAGMSTPTGQALGKRAAEVSPRAWWWETGSTYGLPQ